MQRQWYNKWPHKMQQARLQGQTICCSTRQICHRKVAQHHRSKGNVSGMLSCAVQTSTDTDHCSCAQPQVTVHTLTYNRKTSASTPRYIPLIWTTRLQKASARLQSNVDAVAQVRTLLKGAQSCCLHGLLPQVALYAVISKKRP